MTTPSLLTRPSLAALRRDRPDLEWTAHRDGFGWRYEGAGYSYTLHVRCFAPSFTDDDDAPGVWWCYDRVSHDGSTAMTATPGAE